MLSHMDRICSHNTNQALKLIVPTSSKAIYSIIFHASDLWLLLSRGWFSSLDYVVYFLAAHLTLCETLPFLTW